jgi:alanyl-tRNA synthetase
VGELVASAVAVDGLRVVAGRVAAADADELRALGDRLRQRLGRSGVAVLAAQLDDGKASWLAAVTDDLVRQGLQADELVRRVAALTGGRGGGRPHLALAGVGATERVEDALRQVPELVRSLYTGGHARAPS